VRFAVPRVDFDTLVKAGATLPAFDGLTQATDSDRDPDVFAGRLREIGASDIFTTRGGHRLVIQDLGRVREDVALILRLRCGAQDAPTYEQLLDRASESEP
jgi:hypothetical protein